MTNSHQLATRLGVTARTVDRWARDHAMPHVTVRGRRMYDVDIVLEWGRRFTFFREATRADRT